jgi:YggT family protein
VGAHDASFGLLLDTVTAAQSFVAVFIYVYAILIFAYVITSWIQLPYSLSAVQRFLRDVCEPYLRLFRRILPPLGPIDLSPMVAIGVLVLIERLVDGELLSRLH